MRFAACTLQFCLEARPTSQILWPSIGIDGLSTFPKVVTSWGLGWCESSHVAGRRPTHPSSQSAASMAPTPRWIHTARPTQPAKAGTVALCKRQTMNGRGYPCSRRRTGSTRVGCGYANSGSRTCEPSRQTAALNSLPCASQPAPYSFASRRGRHLRYCGLRLASMACQPFPRS